MRRIALTILALLALAGPALAQNATINGGQTIVGSNPSPTVNDTAASNGTYWEFENNGTQVGGTGIAETSGWGGYSGSLANDVFIYSNSGPGGRVVIAPSQAISATFTSAAASITVPTTLPAVIAGGSPPTASGTCAINTQVGGNTAGSFMANGACAGGTVILTFATTAPHGWRCSANNLTTLADAIIQSAYSTTTCTLHATMASADLATFLAVAF